MSYETNTPDPCIFPHHLCDYITIFITKKIACVGLIFSELMAPTYGSPH